MDRIAEGLYKVHEAASGSGEQKMETDDDVDVTGHRTSNDPIANVRSVVAGSPSADAGLKNDDVIIQFGSLHAGNFKKLDQIGEIVRNSVEKRVRVTVLRDGHVIRMALSPRQWTGQGLLGCTIVPVNS
uniref:26S proteasome non-ATPase regulatory subunit 9 n=1 Tax=Plectus sambesii TaxID=2011161 RepID=A0A914VB28_9BILA